MPFWEEQQTLTAVGWFLRSLITFLWLLLITKLMGQREVGRLTLFDFIIAITIGSVAAAPLGNSRLNLTGALISVTALGGIDILAAYAALKNSRLRRVVQDEPLVLIQNGQILEDTMRKARFNLDDLLAELRLKNVPNIQDVEFAVLESTGKLSVVPKSQARPVTPQDLKIQTKYEGLPSVLVEDGNIVEDNLRENNLKKDWLLKELRTYGVETVDEVMAAVLDTKGRLYVSKSNQTNDEMIH